MASTYDQHLYTPKQAERLKHKIDLEMAKIEDGLHRMGELVPDFGQYPHHPNTLTEEIHENAHKMYAVIDRRTRR